MWTSLNLKKKGYKSNWNFCISNQYFVFETMLLDIRRKGAIDYQKQVSPMCPAKAQVKIKETSKFGQR